ncbi:DMT family transporter [Acidaminobacter hydrogenoformans]|uniref:Threonine/homoserine efflux transporter RhtA n=1 Tax=Acidaminobacter hydrogenoformans DSM 2784 TaxID=1120920 RepID=A0A1G5RZG1_9FIRM|nr:EamA family transporter [Acidaminobacter hydrogenoformans]SCZ79403.1 Threonine/homoserine efflux transporter RhtA [Acidaminobacter hydrogenoformans DSM 2784]
MTLNKPVIFVATAAFLWGLIGLFGTLLGRAGITSLEIVAIRAVFSGVFLTLYWMVRDRSVLKIRPNDLKYFAGTGLLSFLVFNYFFFTTMQLTSIAVSVTLLYTCPIFVVLLSRLFFKEPLTRSKGLALLLTLLGCALVTGLIGQPLDSVPLKGILTGLLSGLTFALYSIFSKMALARSSSATVTTYTFIVASVGILFLVPPTFFVKLFQTPSLLISGMSLSLISTVVPFLLYTRAVQSIEAGRAALITTLEPVVAALLGYLVFNEPMGALKITGILLVAAGVLIVQRPSSASLSEA